MKVAALFIIFIVALFLIWMIEKPKKDK